MAAAPVKTLRYILPAAEASLDPAQGRDLYTGHITEAIFETLYTYDYLARPVRLAADGGSAAASLGRRPQCADPAQARHLFHTRSGLRRPAARTDGGRLPIFMEAPVRSATGFAE
jgi:hypothetical protein